MFYIKIESDRKNELSGHFQAIRYASIGNNSNKDMPRFYQFLVAFRSNDINQRRVLIGLFVLWVLWFAGYGDFIRETGFQHFKWPPYVDVRNQVVRELNGLQSEFLHYNQWTDFQPLVQPTCKKNWLTRKKSVLIAIKTGPNRVERRNAYRKTLSTVRQLNGYRIRTVFVMGHQANEPFVGSALEAEAALHQDMLVADFQDSYFNNTYKFMHSLKLARWHCFPNSSVIPPFLVLLDDDYLIRLDNLLNLLNKHQPNEQLYMGERWDTSPFRLTYRKFRVSIEEYPFDVYPPYIGGGCVVLSPQAIREFYLAAQHLKMFRFDDVYAGIIAYYLGYEAQSNPHILDHKNWYIPWEVKIAEHDYSVEDISNGFALTNFSVST
ncbi:Hexosyltransferase [Aphelenchoides bicaudatus]|nr:Hexosyltransferase [Aphelenchoides bicaudatus]